VGEGGGGVRVVQLRGEHPERKVIKIKSPFHSLAPLPNFFLSFLAMIQKGNFESTLSWTLIVF
jgi:hypothetical protein